MAGVTRANPNWAGVAQTDYSSTSTSGFIPEVWSGKLVEKFYAATVFGAIANTDYEGEIRALGDNVVIRTTPDITISDYQIGQGLTYTQPNSAKVELPINKAKYFAFPVNSVDSMQSDLSLMEDWSADAGEQMKVAIDTDLLANIYADADASNAGATAGAISGDLNLGAAGTAGSNAVQVTSANVIDVILDHGLALDEQNAPENGRFIVLPAWACRYLKSSDLKDASITGDGTSVLRNGRIGMIDRFEVYSSNNVARTESNAVWNIIAGHKKGITFAAQMTDMETLPNPDDFGQLVRGLNVYGYKVINPTLVTHGMIKK